MRGGNCSFLSSIYSMSHASDFFGAKKQAGVKIADNTFWYDMQGDTKIQNLSVQHDCLNVANRNCHECQINEGD